MPSPVFLCPIWDEVLHERRRREGTHFTLQYLSPKDQNHAGGLICVNTNRQGVFILPAVKTLLSSFRAYFEFSYAQINPVTIYIYTIQKNVFCLLLLLWDVWAPPCRLMHVQSFTQGGCFSDLYAESFSAWAVNLIFRGALAGMILRQAHIQWEVSFGEGGDIFCLEVKLLK